MGRSATENKQTTQMRVISLTTWINGLLAPHLTEKWEDLTTGFKCFVEMKTLRTPAGNRTLDTQVLEK